MNKYPDSTYTILTYKEFESRFHFDYAVDWAVEMLEYGYETEHLLMLAKFRIFLKNDKMLKHLEPIQRQGY